MELNIRRATYNDAISFWDWRNDPLTRAMSWNTAPVPLIKHLSWFQRAIQDPNRIMLIADAREEKLGTVRFDIHAPDAWEISYTVAPENRGRNIGSTMVKLSIEKLPQQIRGCSLFAEVKPFNIASKNLLLKCGFVLDHKRKAPNGVDELESFVLHLA